MTTPHVPGEDGQVITALYDSYMKAVLRNRSRTLQRCYYKHAGRESLVADPAEYLRGMEGHIGAADDKNVIEIQGFRCEVSDDAMYRALLSLPTKLQLVVIMWYWHAYKTQDIASFYSVSCRTIRNWHNRAIELLRDSLLKIRKVDSNDAT